MKTVLLILLSIFTILSIDKTISDRYPPRKIYNKQIRDILTVHEVKCPCGGTVQENWICNKCKFDFYYEN